MRIRRFYGGWATDFKADSLERDFKRSARWGLTIARVQRWVHLKHPREPPTNADSTRWNLTVWLWRVYEPEGREFESLRARHLSNPILDWRLSKSTNCPCSVRVFPKTPLPSMSVTGLFRQLLPRGLRTYPRSRAARALWFHPQSFEQ